MTYTDAQIALVCHEANRGLQEVLGDPHPSEPWTVASPELHETVIGGVRGARQGRTPRESHEAWCTYLEARGWRYGPVKDEQALTHPCLLPYDELAPEHRLKDELFLAIVAVMAAQL